MPATNHISLSTAPNTGNTLAKDQDPSRFNHHEFRMGGIANRYIWKCPSSTIHHHYFNYIKPRHLEIGAGNGYFLEQCTKVTSDSTIGIMDIDANAIKQARLRLQKKHLTQLRSYQIRPSHFNDLGLCNETEYQSIGIHDVLHKIPGTLEYKLGNLLEAASIHKNEPLKVFGSLLLSDSESHSLLAKKLIRFYQNRNVFHNKYDSLPRLESTLSQYGTAINIEIVGSIALFSARL